MSQKKIRLFLSCRRTVHALEKGHIMPDDLRGGLFFFRCVKRHAMDPQGIALEISGCQRHRLLRDALACEWCGPSVKAQIHLIKELRRAEKEKRTPLPKMKPYWRLFREADRRAKKEGRVKFQWHEKALDRYERLARLLSANGVARELDVPPLEMRRWIFENQLRFATPHWEKDLYDPRLAAKLVREQLHHYVDVVIE